MIGGGEGEGGVRGKKPNYARASLPAMLLAGPIILFLCRERFSHVYRLLPGDQRKGDFVGITNDCFCCTCI